MPEKRTIPDRDEHARHAHRPVYPGRHRGRRLLGVDAYGFAHYRAGDWVEIVRHAAVVADEDDRVEVDGRTDRRDDVRRDDRRDDAGPRDHDGARPGRDDVRSGRHDTRDGVPYERAADEPRVETDLVTVHEVPLHLVDVSLDEYLRSVGDFLGPVAEMGFRPVEGASPGRWEWVSQYARQWVAAFGNGEGPPDASDSGASA